MQAINTQNTSCLCGLVHDYKYVHVRNIATSRHLLESQLRTVMARAHSIIPSDELYVSIQFPNCTCLQVPKHKTPTFQHLPTLIFSHSEENSYSDFVTVAICEYDSSNPSE